MKTLLFLCSVLAVAAAVASAARPDIVEDTCKKCSSSDPNVNYTLCVNSFDSVPKSHRADLRGLGVIAAKLARANAKLVRTKIKNILKSHPKDRSFQQCLETCLELYSDSASNLEDAATAIRDGRYRDANIKISAAVDAPGQCEDGFSERGIESPLKKDDDEFFGHAVVALAVTAMLQGRV